MYRSDGYRVKGNDPMYEIVPHIMPQRPEFATSSHNNIKLFLYFSRFSLIFLCPYDIMCM